MSALLTLQGIHKSFHGKKLLDGVALVVGDGERIALLGPNGSGKSTLLRILAGVEEPESGERTLRRGAKLGYLEQDPFLDPDLSLQRCVHLGMTERVEVEIELARVHFDLERGDLTAEAMERLLARQSALDDRIERLGGHDVDARIVAMLHDVGLPDPDRLCGQLSGGERRRVALARLFFSKPDLLLLDEPTNHLDALVVDWLEDRLLELDVPIVLVTHDRYFLDRVVHRIVEIDRSVLVPYEGGYGDYLVARADRLIVEEKQSSARANLLRRETTWMRRGAPARSTKQKARISRFTDLVDSELAPRERDLELVIPPGPRLGTKVIEARCASAGYGARVVVEPLDISIGPGERIGIVGPNGAGKTTLLKMLLGQLAVRAGRVDLGETVRSASIDQARTTLDPEKTVLAEVAGRNDQVLVGDRAMRAEAFLERFLFPGDMKHALVGRLSGGERNRLLLAKLLLEDANVLALDEPTNDLDLTTLRALEEALIAFPGTVLVVSHDRWFLDRIATRILFVDGHGRVRHHPGDLTGLFEILTSERDEAQRRVDAAGRTARDSVSSSADRPAAKKKLAPWERREYEEITDQITLAETELAALDERLSDPHLYQGPKHDLDSTRAARLKLAERVAALYARWETLAALDSSP